MNSFCSRTSDRFSQILRYVHINNGEVEVKECFVDFLPLDGKAAEALTDMSI